MSADTRPATADPTAVVVEQSPKPKASDDGADFVGGIITGAMIAFVLSSVIWAACGHGTVRDLEADVDLFRPWACKAALEHQAEILRNHEAYQAFREEHLRTHRLSKDEADNYDSAGLIVHRGDCKASKVW